MRVNWLNTHAGSFIHAPDSVSSLSSRPPSRQVRVVSRRDSESGRVPGHACGGPERVRNAPSRFTCCRRHSPPLTPLPAQGAAETSAELAFPCPPLSTQAGTMCCGVPCVEICVCPCRILSAIVEAVTAVLW